MYRLDSLAMVFGHVSPSHTGNCLVPNSNKRLPCILWKLEWVRRCIPMKTNRPYGQTYQQIYLDRPVRWDHYKIWIFDSAPLCLRSSLSNFWNERTKYCRFYSPNQIHWIKVTHLMIDHDFLIFCEQLTWASEKTAVANRLNVWQSVVNCTKGADDAIAPVDKCGYFIRNHAIENELWNWSADIYE